MAEDTTNADQIVENSQAPQSVTGDQGSVTQHSIPDQIAADKYRRQVGSGRRGLGGIRIAKIVMPGNG